MNRIHDLDLNLLRVFMAIFEERSVRRASERLNITSSAVSHALGRLREATGDELFVRGPSGMAPSPKAIELARAFREGLHRIDTALSETSFDPQSARVEFSIATSDYVAITILPALMRRLQAEAPKSRIWVRPLSAINVVEELDRGHLNLAIGMFGRGPTRFLFEPLFQEENVWMMRNDHPASASRLTLEILAEYPHLDILMSRQSRENSDETVEHGELERPNITSRPRRLDALLAEHGLSRQVLITASTILAIPPIIAATDMLVLVPKRLAQASLATHGLIFSSAPYHVPPLDIQMVTHRTLGSHPSVVWLKHILREVAGTDGSA